VEPYLDALLGALMTLLQSNHLKIQESSLTAVAAIALIAEEKFSK
jgi:hypothetical protein